MPSDQDDVVLLLRVNRFHLQRDRLADEVAQLREAKQFNAREFRILAAQSVIDMFLDEESQSLAQLGDFIGKPISLQVETIYTQEQYDIVLI